MDDLEYQCGKYGIELTEEVKQAMRLQEKIRELEREMSMAEDHGECTFVDGRVLAQMRSKLDELTERIRHLDDDAD